MYSLHTLHALNAKRCAAPASESETTRHCSHCVQPNGDVILHSAKHRNTAYISGHTAKQFLVEFQFTNSEVKQDEIVERYFNAVGTGKQSIAA